MEGTMRLVHIRAETDEDVDCLMRELSAYSPKRSSRVVLIDLQERPQTDLLALFTALEACLSSNDIRSVRIEVDGQTYMMEPST
jgi:hypothetical protein